MNWLDAFLPGLLAIAALRGWRSGFLRSTTGLAALAAGIFVGSQGWPLLQSIVLRSLPEPRVAKWGSVILLAAATTFVVDWLLQKLRRMLEESALAVVNRLAGLALHTCLMGLVLGIALMIAQQVGAEEWVEGSFIAPLLQSATEQVLGIGRSLLPVDAEKIPAPHGKDETKGTHVSLYPRIEVAARGMVMKSSGKLLMFYLFLLGIAVLWLGCGSTVETPTYSDGGGSDTSLEAPPTLQVTVRTDKAGPYAPGEVVQLSASVEAVRGSSVNFNWINVTGYGVLSDTTRNTVTWTAPTDIAAGQIKVEVIQLVVTVISQVISVDESGVQTDTQISTENRTLPLTTVGD